MKAVVLKAAVLKADVLTADALKADVLTAAVLKAAVFVVQLLLLQRAIGFFCVVFHNRFLLSIYRRLIQLQICRLFYHSLPVRVNLNTLSPENADIHNPVLLQTFFKQSCQVRRFVKTVNFVLRLHVHRRSARAKTDATFSVPS